MFKAFTWTKFLGGVAVLGAVLGSPLAAGLFGAAFAVKLGAVGAILREVSSLFTTKASGNATDANNVPLNAGGGQ